MQFAALSNRPAITLDHALLGSLHPAGLAQLVVADIFGSHGADYWGPNGATEPLVALTDDSFNYLFVGAVPVDPAALVRHRRRRRVPARPHADRRHGRRWRCSSRSAATRRRSPGRSTGCRASAASAARSTASFVFVAMLALLCGALLADYIREGVPRRRLLASIAVALAALAVVAAGVVFSGRVGHSGDALMAVLTSVPIVAAVILMLALARGARTRSVAAVAVTAIAVAELIWWNAAFRLNAEPHAIYARAGAAVRRGRRRARSGRACGARAPQQWRAPARRDRWGSAAPGRTSRWCARSKRSTATIRCASASMTGWWRPARPTGAWSCAISRRRSTATTARSPARSASNSWCSAGRSRRCRISRAGRSPTCCAPGPTSGSTG